MMIKTGVGLLNVNAKSYTQCTSICYQKHFNVFFPILCRTQGPFLSPPMYLCNIHNFNKSVFWKVVASFYVKTSI